MKRFLCVLMLFALISASMFAQFEKGKKYVGASLSSAGLSYSDYDEFALGINLVGGYMIEQDWMLMGDFGMDLRRGDFQEISLGGKVRYYIEQNGLFLSAGLRYLHRFSNFNDLQLTPEVGYCFFLGGHVSIEPALYYDMSLSDFGHKSKVGVKVGLGYYF